LKGEEERFLVDQTGWCCRAEVLMVSGAVHFRREQGEAEGWPRGQTEHSTLLSAQRPSLKPS